MNDVLVKLLSESAVRMGNHSWKWRTRKPGNPSLNNAVTSKMFRAGLVEEIENEMCLTTFGKIRAMQLINGVEK